MQTFLRSNKWLVLVAIALVALPIVSRLAYRTIQERAMVVQAASIPHAQFTLELVEVHRKGPSLTSPPTKVARRVVVAQRADGSRSEISVMFPGQPYSFQFRRIKLANMQHTTAHDSVGMKSTGPPAPEQIIARRPTPRPSPKSDCMPTNGGAPAWQSHRSGGSEVINGLRTIKLLRDNPQAEAWHAPELDCEVVRSVTAFRGCCTQSDYEADSSKQITDSTELSMTSYSIGPPDPRLFDTSQLRESLPSTAYQAEWRKASYPEPFIQKQLADLRKSDESYLKTRDAAGIRP